VTCFVDNDIIHKLAAFDLLDETWRALAQPESSVRILPTARFKFHVAKNPAKGVKRYGEVVFERIRQFVLSATEVEQTNQEDEETLQGVLGIDAGEVILFSAASRDPHSILITGDKVAVRALVSTERCSAVVERLRGRVVSLEDVMLRLIRAHGFEYVQGRVVPMMQHDMAMRAVFGSGMRAKEADVVAALTAYVADMPAGLMIPHGPEHLLSAAPAPV